MRTTSRMFFQSILWLPQKMHVKVVHTTRNFLCAFDWTDSHHDQKAPERWTIAVTRHGMIHSSFHRSLFLTTSLPVLLGVATIEWLDAKLCWTSGKFST